MKSPTISPVPEMQTLPDGFPVESELAALRVCYASLSQRDAVIRSLSAINVPGHIFAEFSKHGGKAVAVALS